MNVVPSSPSHLGGAGPVFTEPHVSTAFPYHFLLLLLLIAPLVHTYRGFKDHSQKPLSVRLIKTLSWLRYKLYSFVYNAILNCARPVLSINLFPRKIVVADPLMESALSRHTSETSLANVIFLIGHRVFGLSDSTIQAIGGYDPRPIHIAEFSPTANARALLATMAETTSQKLQSQPDVQETQLGPWLFKLTSSAVASALWGPESPWVVDEEFQNHFMELSGSQLTLLRPFAKYTAKAAYKARAFIINRLQAAHANNRPSRVRQIAHRINAVVMSDPDWESNKDYFNVELLTSLGLMVTPSTMAVWMVRHLLLRPDLLDRVVKEARNPNALDDEGNIDLIRIRESFPFLAACVYETLRLHMTAIPRVAKADFDVAVPNSQPIHLKSGDLIYLAMSSFNRSTDAWGPDAATFSPERLLGSSGGPSTTLTRKLRIFGVAGNSCPGRKVGFDTILYVVASMLRDFDIENPRGEQYPEPRTEDGFGIGFERCANDINIRLRRVA
ncbi:cytochrome P450 [Trichoderma austrokoningii]